MGSWTRDLRIAARSLARRPGFALGVALTLGLGIGATTTIYSVVDGVMLRPLPYDDPSTLVSVGSLVSGMEWVDGDGTLQDLGKMSVPDYQDLQERARSFETLAAIDARGWGVTLAVDDGVEEVAGSAASAELFEILGVSPALGRTFLPEDENRYLCLESDCVG